MKLKLLFAAAAAACMMIQPYMTSFADEGQVNANMVTPAPGSEAPEMMLEPWVKYGDSYVDDKGTVIEGALLRGVSVSSWQGDIDWAKAAADDVSFALIRMGSFGYQGENTMDDKYDQNMRGAKEHGVHTTPYVFLQANTVEGARAAARYALEKAAPYEITYPLAVDIESKQFEGLSVQELTDVVNAFCQVIEEAGYTPIIYSDYYRFRDTMDIKQFKYDLWLARYGGDHTMDGRTMWQCTDKGRVDGIKGNVCLEFAFKDYGAAQVTDRSDYTPGQWEQVNNTWFFSNGGNRYTGWIKPDGNWYYMDPNNGGMMVANTTMVIDGVSYTFGASGAMQ